MAISKEQAKQDLEKIMQQFGTIGAGTECERAAQLVMQTLGVFEKRLENKEMIKILYLDNPDASKLLPQTVYNTAQEYVDGKIQQEDAKVTLQDAIHQYAEVFQEMKIKPQDSVALLQKF